MSKIDSFHSYLQATKDMAPSVVHRYYTCDDEPDVAWEIIEDIMEGLIAVFLDMFGEEENPIHKNLTERDMERDIDSTNERIDELEARIDMHNKQITRCLLALARMGELDKETKDEGRNQVDDP